MIDLKGKRILVTGGAGFIGSHIIDLLCDEGCIEIVALDNMLTGRPQNLQKALTRGPVRLVHGDIRDTKLLEALVKAADIVFHQAALRNTRCVAEPRLAMDVMVNGTFELLELCAKHDVEKIIAASSSSVYGMAEEFPTTERQNFLGNRTVYGAARACNEGLLRAYNDLYGIDYVAFRYFNVYGSRMDVHARYAEMLIRWMEQLEAGAPPVIFGLGQHTLDLVHVHDAARANILAARAEVSDEVFNVGSGIETSLIQLASALANVMGHRGVLPQFAPERSINPIPRRVASTGKAERLLGFHATVSLEHGLAEFVKWWRSERGIPSARQRHAAAP